MKKLIIFLLMILPLGVFAQEAKVAIVNSQEIMMAMPEITAMQETMKQMNDKYAGEMKTMEDEFQKKQDMNKKQQELLAPIQEKLRNAIKAVGDEKGYAYIIDNNPGIVLYTGNAAIDATPLVKAKLGLK